MKRNPQKINGGSFGETLHNQTVQATRYTRRLTETLEALMKYVFPDNNELQISQTKNKLFELILTYPSGGKGQPWSSVVFSRQLISDFRTLLKSRKNGVVSKTNKLSKHSMSISGGSIKTLEVYRELTLLGFVLTAVTHSVDLYIEQPVELDKWLSSNGF